MTRQSQGDRPITIEAQIQQYVAENLLFSDQGHAFDLDASFLREGIIDSLGVVELVTYAGSAFGIAVDPQEVTPENFDSISRLANFIRRKQAQLPAGAA